MDIWALCQSCSRWYYPDPQVSGRVPACPVCMRAPDLLEDRAAPSGSPRHMAPEEWGACARTPVGQGADEAAA